MKKKFMAILMAILILSTSCLREEEKYESRRQASGDQSNTDGVNTDQTNNQKNNQINNQVDQENKAQEENNPQNPTEQKQEDKNLKVNVDQLNLRENPSTEANLVGQLPLGTEVKILEENLTGEAEGWVKVEANGLEGYVSKEFLGE
ncbi:MAG: SH3 domain-containing protein [Finegoldia sp.]|nr:SH3 domain-containing protein [Finegoldia sp.]